MSKTYSIVGMEHRKMEGFVSTLPVGADVTLVREPNNPFAPCAIAVWINGNHVGYIPKKQNVALANQIDQIASTSLAMDALPPGLKVRKTEKAIPAKFVRSPNSGYPQVAVEDASE